MTNQTAISIGLGLIGAVILLGPKLLSMAKGLLAKEPAAPVHPEQGGHLLLEEKNLETVLQLSALVSLRAYLSADPKAQEVIDTVLAPSVLQASGGAHESK